MQADKFSQGLIQAEHNNEKIKNVRYIFLKLLGDNIGHRFVTILLAKVLIWALFSQSLCIFSVLTPVSLHLLGFHMATTPTLMEF